MMTFKVSDALYERLKSYVVDPFDDSPEVVIGRLMEIVDKAKDRWSPFESCENAPAVEPAPRSRRKEPEPADEDQVVVL
ncbi:MAG: hypothetical protein MUC88_12360 [Planctomycetes bacterium]|jgi:hypothetical protein|nr:hypothetical protein [Planctomycetota bacterium]